MNELENARKEINRIDEEMAKLFEERMKVCETIAAYKKERGLSVHDDAREAALIERNRQYIGDTKIETYYVPFLKNMIALSCAYQTRLMNGLKTAYRSFADAYRMVETGEAGGTMIIPVHSDMRDYEIRFGTGILGQIGGLLNLDRKALIVTDSGVPKQYAEAVTAACAQPVLVSVPAGEASKSIDMLQTLLREMHRAGFTREDCVVAVGGGVVGDLSGFAASCYMRGVDFYNVPTTLLAQVDSSIGGKTAVNFEGMKNIVGAFYQPMRVVIDTEVLETLSERLLHEGLAEAVKMAAACDAELFEKIERSSNLHDDLPEIISRAIMIKKNVVEQDPTEKGLRRVLNFGHTVGHAAESLSGKLLHGECVAIGMLPMSGGSARERIKALLKKYDLPTELPGLPEELLPYILHDKKKTADGITAVVVDEIGSFRFENMTPEMIQHRMEEVR
ncbi:MAG: 3-dehydroquinate synthase [Eubacteriales bacterium]|nr:3-dehydroquinate synthase [Eubacteriales bacterium]